MRRLVASSSVLCLIAAAQTQSCASSGTETDNPGDAPTGVELRRSSEPYLADEAVPASDRDALRAGLRAFSPGAPSSRSCAWCCHASTSPRRSIWRRC